MVKRTATAVLWFFTVASAWNYGAMLSDLPSSFGLALGAAAAAFVWADPLHRLWSTSAGASARRTGEPAVMTGALEPRA